MLREVKMFANHCPSTLSLVARNVIRRVTSSHLICRFVSQIYSVAGDGTDGHSCRLFAYSGTSMSCPIVAGASAMVSS